MMHETVYLPIRWDGPPRAALAERVAAACAAFEAKVGYPPTHIRVPANSGNPPPGCGLVWTERSTIAPGELWPGVEREVARA